MPLIRFPLQQSLWLLRKNDDTIIYWIENLLSYRYINASLGGDDFNIHANVGCPQRNVLLPILWCLIEDSLLENLNRLSLICIGYGDDVVIAARSL